ncbi:MAG TPA: tetratricopeptide repeat protein [Planctomycetota bacterium]
MTPRPRDGTLLLALLAATVAVYWRALSGELVYDDRLLIARNPLIADLANLPRLFTSGYWDFLDLREAEYIGYWRPLTAIVQALVWPFARSAPGPYHAVCLAIHLGAVAAAFGLAKRLGAPAWIAAATALLFALHPAHVESVAWISALNDPLFGCLALVSLERFLAWRARGSRGLPWTALVAFGLALLAKELAAALVPLLVLLDLLRPPAPDEVLRPLEAPTAWPAPLRRAVSAFALPAAPARAFGPFAALFALYLVARMLVFTSPWAGFDRITTDFLVGALRLALLRVELFGGALEILLVPLELNLFRPFRPHIEPFDPALVRAAVYTAVFAALLVAALLGRRRLLLAGLVFVPAGLLPALIKVQSLGAFPLSERFLYLPVFGFALAVALLLRRVLPARGATAALLVVAGLYSVRTWTRIGVWHDEETLFRDAAARSPRSVYVQWGLGRVLLERLNETRDGRYLAEAEATFEHAAGLLEESKAPTTDLMVTSRDFLQVNLGLAWCAIAAGDSSAATLMLEELVRRLDEIEAGERAARERGLAVREQFLDREKVLTALGVAQARGGRPAEAEASFQRALELQPSSAETRQNYGRMLAEQGRWEEAAREFEACVRLRPGHPEDRLLLAQAWQTLGKAAEAEALARELTEELPRRSEPMIVLASGALRRGDSGAALTWLERALALEPRNALAWYQKARALLQREDARAAVLAFRQAVELDPQGFEAHYDLGAFLLGQGALAEAQPYLVRAYALAPEAHRAALAATLAQLELDGPEPYLELAESDARRGARSEALAWLDRARALAPDSLPALRLRAELLRRLERPAEAAEALRTLTEREPADYQAWVDLATTLEANGALEPACRAAERALLVTPPPSMPEEIRTATAERMRKLRARCAATPGGD